MEKGEGLLGEDAEGQTQNDGENQEGFNPLAFLKETSAASGENGEGNDAGGNDGDGTGNDDEGFEFNFEGDDDAGENGDDAGGNDGDEGGNGEGAAGGNEPAKPDPAKEQSSVEFVSGLEKIGIKATNVAEALEQIKKIQDDALEIKTKYVTNDKVEYFKKLLPLGDKELVEKDLKARGFAAEKLEKALKTFETNDTMDIEAEKIRIAIRERIEHEVQTKAHTDAEIVAKRTAQQVEARKQLKDHVDKTETMFGFKLAKTPADLPKVREWIYKYIDSGRFMNDVLKDPATVTEIAYFVKNKDQILKAFKNKGAQSAKRDFIADLGNHTQDNTTRIPGSEEGNGEFNPQKFADV